MQELYVMFKDSGCSYDVKPYNYNQLSAHEERWN